MRSDVMGQWVPASAGGTAVLNASPMIFVRILRIVLGLVLVAAASTVYFLAMTMFADLSPDMRQAAAQVIIIATLAVAILFLIGTIFGISGHAYYLICGGAVFFGADLFFSLVLGIRLGIKPSQHGFLPFAIAGVFLGPLYRAITMTARPLPRDPLP